MNRIMRMLVLVVAIGLVPAMVYANDSAMNDGAYGPEPLGWRPGEESVIRMVDEKLTIDFAPRTSNVRVVFSFVNTGRIPARQLLGFPDESAAEAEEARRGVRRRGDSFMIGPMKDVVTVVNGKTVQADRKIGYICTTGTGTWEPATPDTGEAMVWWTMWVDFPPGETVTVERRYQVRNATGSVNNPDANVGDAWFQYITTTGAAWKGTIGMLIADVFLRDGLTIDDIGGRGGSEVMVHQGWQQVSRTHLRLQWRDFEPALDSNRRYFDVGIQSVGGRPPSDQLLYAARTGDGKILVPNLLADTSIVNCRDNRERTPLWWAVESGRLAMVRELLDAGADPNLADEDGMTPLMVAARSGATDLAVLLLEHGAAAGRRDRKGRSAHDYAEYNGYSETARLLTGSLRQPNR